MGLEIRYFYSLTPRQFNNIATGIRKKIETEYKIQWEQQRFTAYFTYLSIPLKKGIKHAESPEKFYPFSWETQQGVQDQKISTPEEARKFWEDIDKKRNSK